MQIYQKASLKNHHTFQIDVQAEKIYILESKKDISDVIESINKNNFLVVGEGSNLLFTKHFKGDILLMKNKGIELVKENEDFVWIKASAGEIWHSFVKWTLDNDYFGLENMALIPGTLGAAPVQNVGAYGKEAKDFVESVHVFDLQENKWKELNKEECDFSYRNSHFKKHLGRYIVESVILKLNKKPNLNIEYGAIKETLKIGNVVKPTPVDVFDAVVKIRSSKLPDVKKIPNAGSFFKNPIISELKFKELLKKYPNIANYPLPNNKVKLAAGWLIENLGWKGKKIDNVGVYDKQSLVLINLGNANGEDVNKLSKSIIDDVYTTFKVELEREVQVF